jgi:hypothetical protein
MKQVYAEVLNRKAQVVFEKKGIGFEWKEIVHNILNLNKTGVCPFEKITADISEPEESYVTFKALLEKMKQCR